MNLLRFRIPRFTAGGGLGKLSREQYAKLSRRAHVDHVIEQLQRLGHPDLAEQLLEREDHSGRNNPVVHMRQAGAL